MSWSSILTAEEWASARALRLIIIGGEATLAERAEKFRKRTNGRIELMNTYGPTETTIVATMSKIVGQTDILWLNPRLQCTTLPVLPRNPVASAG